jgi:hypothetical protein
MRPSVERPSDKKRKKTLDKEEAPRLQTSNFRKATMQEESKDRLFCSDTGAPLGWWWTSLCGSAGATP